MDLTVGQEIELEINDVAYGGSGVGRVEGCAVFVPGGLAGERVRARVCKSRKRYVEAELLEVISASEQRIKPLCSYTGRCPGCCYQHVEYAEEVRIKQRQLDSLLQRIGGLSGINFLEPIASPSSLAYRNKVVLHAQRERKLGYFGADNRTVVDIERCALAVEPINKKLEELRANIKFMKNLPPRAGVTLRWTEHDGVVYWVDRNSGVDRLTEQSLSGEIRLPRRSFYQVNSDAGRLLTKRVRDLTMEIGPRYFIDLYCGVGIFALEAAAAGVPHVLGIEKQSMAVRAARQNAKAHGLEAEFVAAAAEDVADEALERVACSETLVVFDPPRQGLEKGLISDLVSRQPRDIIYVSCAPDTLARDLKLLTKGGYDVVSCQLLDMFPRTQHFESITHLRLVESK